MTFRTQPVIQMNNPTLVQFALTITAVALGFGAASRAEAQHVHLTAGALSTSPGSPLSFVNSASFVASSGYVFNMVLRTNGTLDGLYDGGPTFTAAGSDGFDGPPAASGAQIALVVKSLVGPKNSTWGFWESLECDDVWTNLTFSISSGVTNGTNRFLVSQTNNFPDPFGHCHGRRFSISEPGLHTLGVQLVDVSRSGPGGGPIHTPSPIYPLHFQAGYTISKIERTNNVVANSFGTRTGSRFYLEGNSVLGDSSPWTTIAGPVSGNSRLQTLNDAAGFAETNRFYRLRVTTP